MIKFKIECELPRDNEASNVTWVTKRKVNNPNSGAFIGLRFHKITPRIIDSFRKNDFSESSC